MDGSEFAEMNEICLSSNQGQTTDYYGQGQSQVSSQSQ